MIRKVRIAVFPAAGLGTRLLPATRAVPKAMLTLVDRPIIQHVVDEAVAAEIDHFVFVVGANGGSIEEHFGGGDERAARREMPRRSEAGGELNRPLSQTGVASFRVQNPPLGLGHAIWCARDLIGDEPFAVLTPDAIMRGEPGCLTQILETYNHTGGNVLSVEEVRPEQTDKYGIVGIGETISDAAFRITTMVEKPATGSAPSNLKISGRYVLQPEILAHLGRQAPGVDGEIQLTDALIRLAEEQPVFGHRFRGRSFDCGSREGLVAASVAFALDDAQLAPIVQREIDLFLGQANRLAPDETK